jgi:hypothetical protein
MNITRQNSDLNAFALKGDMIAAVTQFFADDSKTIDHTGVTLKNKKEHLEKMEGFLGGIAKVNGITLHYVGVGEDVSFNEFTFDFDMKDNSRILWHEVIRRLWKDGKVIEESYFIL